LDEQDDPPKHGVFCPQCRENGLSAPGVLHFKEVAAPTGKITELATLRAENARLREEIEKLRSAAGYQAEAHTLRTSAKMTADLVRSWGYANKSNESNGQLVRRVLEELRAALAAKEPGHE
jgi:hypothetical protein